MPDDQEMALPYRGLRAGQDPGWLHCQNVRYCVHEEDQQTGESHLLRTSIKEEADQTKNGGDHANEYSEVQPQRSRPSLVGTTRFPSIVIFFQSQYFIND